MPGIFTALVGWGKLAGVLGDVAKGIGAWLHDHQVAVNQKAKDLNEARTKTDERVADALDARDDDSLRRTVDATRYRD